jgi:hypothetical protein
MILDCVISACNDNPMYIDFVPLFIETWRKLYPHVDVKVILILANIPENLIRYQNNIILFAPLENISTAFTSQYIRLLYPAILNYENGILISDIDMIPMNRTYYTKNIENIGNDKFIYMRDVLLNDYKQIAMCYNVALKETWGDIFGIHNLEDIINRLREVYKSIEYVDGHANSGWCTDQIDFYNYVMKWNSITNRFVILSDRNTGYCRLDRGTFPANLNINNRAHNNLIRGIRSGSFSDYHLYRPFSQYKALNINIYNIL